MILRENYLNQIRPFVNQPVVKVITGIRRSGKSELLKMVRLELQQSGVTQEQIVYINFESMQWDAYRNATALYAYLKEQKEHLSARLYLLLDEIQEVQGWERVINSLGVGRRYIHHRQQLPPFVFRTLHLHCRTLCGDFRLSAVFSRVSYFS